MAITIHTIEKCEGWAKCGRCGIAERLTDEFVGGTKEKEKREIFENRFESRGWDLSATSKLCPACAGERDDLDDEVGNDATDLSVYDF